MKKRLAILAAILTAAVVTAAPRAETVSVATGAFTYGTNTLSIGSGYLEDLYITSSNSASVAKVYVAVLRPGTGTADTIATNTVTGELLVRPVVDSTDGLGAALTSDPPRRMYLYGETVRLIVLASPANERWTARFKLVDE